MPSLDSRKQEKTSPAFRAMMDYITGSYWAATPETVAEQYKKMSDSEKERYRVALAERRTTVEKLLSDYPREDGNAERAQTLKAIKLIYQVLGFDVPKE